MASPGRARAGGAPRLLRPFGYGAAAAGFTALALLLLHMLLAQRLERQQRRQLVGQVSTMVLLGEVALERYNPAELSEVLGTRVALGPRPPLADPNAPPADGTLRRQAEALRADLCSKLTACPVVWAVGQRRGVWVQLNSPLETAWVFAPIPALRGWPPDPQLLTLAVALGGLTTLLLYLSLEVQRPLRQLDGALGEVGLDQQPEPLAARGTGAVRHLTGHFNAMVLRLQEASQERATMLGGIAHDLRSPLTRLRLRLEKQESWSAEERRRAEGDLAALERITEQFLLFVRSDAQEPPVRLPLQELVAEAANAVDAVELDLEPMERRVRPVALSRAVANLLLNAEHYGQPPLKLVLRALPQEGFAIEVWDRGQGLSPAEWERARQPFQRLDRARGGVGHSGLGLAIAERVARAHGGELNCHRSSDGETPGFVVTLTGASLQSHPVTS
ncbi:MAG: ATP-binding protein [Cyanobium sp.]